MLYALTILLLSPLLACWLMLSMRGRIRIADRFGGGSWKLVNKADIWFHGASLGEIKGLIPVIKRYKSANPNEKILITVTSATALGLAKDNADFACILPFDSMFFYKRAVNKLRFRKVIVTETEIWPGMLAFLTYKKIPVYWINARISGASVFWYRRLGFVFSRAIRSIACIGAVDESNKQKFLALKIPQDKLTILRNSKYERIAITKEEARSKIHIVADVPVISIGNIRPGEEEILFSAILQFQDKAVVFITPRHQEYFNYFRSRLPSNIVGSHEYRKAPEKIRSGGIVLVEEFGVLEAVYAQSDLVISAGSFISKYKGHNLLEAAPYKSLLVTGPFNESSQEVYDGLKDVSACKVASSIDELMKIIEQFLSVPRTYDDVRERYYEYWQQYQDASENIFSWLEGKKK